MPSLVDLSLTRIESLVYFGIFRIHLSSLVWHKFLTMLNMLFLYYMVLKSLIAETRSISRLYVRCLCSGSMPMVYVLERNAQAQYLGSILRLNVQAQ